MYHQKSRNQIMAQAQGAMALYAAFVGLANPLFATLAKSGKSHPSRTGQANRTWMPVMSHAGVMRPLRLGTWKKPIANYKLRIWGGPSCQKRRAQ